jgi:hypothetical protein
MKAAIVSLFSVLLLTGSSAVAGTSIKGNIAPVPADCNSGPGFCKNGLPQTADCGLDNANCPGATQMKAKLKLKDKLELKVSIKKLSDNDGNLVSTDGTPDTADDHILKLSVNRCIVDNGAPSHCANPRSIYVKLEIAGGEANVTADLSQVFSLDASLSAIGITGASLAAAAANAVDCDGTNAAADIAARVDDPDCEPLGGLVYGVYGIVKP